MPTIFPLHLVVLVALFHSSYPLLHPSSPCPSVFSYEGSEPEADRWYGEVVINTREHLVGVRLNIQMDRRAHLMVSWLGEVTSSDNKEFTVLNLDQRLDPGRPLTTRIMVRFDPAGGSPKVKTVYLNGKQICPGEPPIQVNALNKNSSKPSSSGLNRPDPIFITDTLYNPSVTTYDDYYSEFFNINQQNANKKTPDKVYANTESSVPEAGHGKPHKSGHKGAHQKPAQNTDTSYTQSNTDYVKPSEHNSYSNSQQSNVAQSNKKKTQDDSEYVQPKPQQTYTDTDSYVRPQSNIDEYGNYNPRPQTSGATNYNRPQSNSDGIYNGRPSNADTSYNTRPQATNDNNNYDTNSRPQSSGTNSFGTGNNANNYNSGSNSGSFSSAVSSPSSYPGASSNNGYNSVSRPQANPDSTYNTKPQTSYVDSYNRPQENSDGGYVSPSNSGSSYQTNGASYSSNAGYSGSQATVNNGYSTTNSNSRPTNNAGQNTQSQNGDISDIAEHLIEDGDTNKTVIITVIKHNPQETTTEAHKSTTSSNKPKTSPKPSNNQNDNKNAGNSQGQPLNTQHSQRRPSENGNKKPAGNNNNNNGGQSNSNSNKNVQCGTVVYNKAQPLVTNGQKTARGQWPWHAALYKTEGINLSYICGGSLVSPKYVITAAHCVTKKPYDKPVDSDTIVIYLGKYHQHQFSDEGGVQNKQVKRIHVYPTYNSSNYLGDVALLRLSSEVDYSTYVRPVCLWDDSTAPLQLSAVEGLDGTVIGWGYDENNRVTEELKMAQMPVVSNEQCLWSYPQFFSQFTSDVTYCAGFRNGTSVCNGDSGGGMVFKMESNWYLRGIVSITVARDGLRICDTKHYVVFTDVAKYLAWVRPILADSGN